MLPELLQGDGSYHSLPFVSPSVLQGCLSAMGKLGGGGISVELEAQTAAKLAGRQCPEWHVLL